MYIARNKFRFATLKRILFILSIFLLTTSAALAQTARTSSVANNGVKAVRFYPNPATSFITFEFQSSVNLSNYNFRIYNFIGKKIVEINNVTPRTIVNLNEYFRGVYIFQLSDRKGQIIESGKFQVVK